MEEYKSTAWKLFKNTVERKTEDVIAAGFFIEVVSKVVKEQVEVLIPIDVKDKIYSLFGNGKAGLIKQILTDLAEDGSFSKYREFIMNPTTYADKWISNLTKQKLFKEKEGKMTVYAFMAQYRLQQSFKQIKECISYARR